jgi:hypothetical protein
MIFMGMLSAFLAAGIARMGRVYQGIFVQYQYFATTLAQAQQYSHYASADVGYTKT